MGLHAPRASVLFWAASTRPRCGLYTTYEGRTLFTPTNTYASLKFILPLRQFAGPRMLQYSRKRLRTAAQHRESCGPRSIGETETISPRTGTDAVQQVKLATHRDCFLHSRASRVGDERRPRPCIGTPLRSPVDPWIATRGQQPVLKGWRTVMRARDLHVLQPSCKPPPPPTDFHVLN